MVWSLVLILALTQTELPPEARLTPEAPKATELSVFTRSLLATGAGTLAGGISLGITYLLVSKNPNFDPAFATAALSSILITGAAFTVDQLLGGHGEVTLGFLLAALVMAGSAGIASTLDAGREMTPVYITAIGALPAAAAAVFALEITSPKPKTHLSVAWGPTGVYGTF